MSVADSTPSQSGDLPVGPNDQGVHAYRPPPDGALRAPCPALNALANHSYLPHDGKDITFSKIITALREGFGLSHGFAIFMAIGTYTLLRQPFLSTIDLKDASTHNYIEHDASMVHRNTPAGDEYAPIQIDPALLKTLLRSAHSSKSRGLNGMFAINSEDLAKLRIEREGVCPRLDALHAELARAEFAMVQEIFGRGENKEVTEKDMEIFVGHERFPPGWKPTHVIHLWDAISRSNEIRGIMNKLKEAEAHLEKKQDEEAAQKLEAAVNHIIASDDTTC